MMNWVNSEELLIIREVKMFLAQRRKGKIPNTKNKATVDLQNLPKFILAYL